VWDHDGVRDDVRAYLVEHLGDPEAVLVIDETGDLKSGTATVGVQRQYTGTAGRVENAQVAVYLVYATDAGHGLIDRELYLPRSWTGDPGRLQAAGVPDQVGFATKPELATRMLARALDAGVPAAWVTGDEVYGANPGLRAELEGRGVGYVLVVARDHRVVAGGDTYRADELAARVPARAWQQISCGKGAKGHRFYDWAFIRSTTMASVLLARPPSAGCWSAATSAPGSWPSTAALCPARCRCGPCPGGWAALDHRGALPDRQGPGRLGPAPAAPLALLVPLGHVGDARPRLPGGGGVDRPGPRSRAVRADHADLQRGPAPVRGSARSAHP
jgi:hypothetical protein